MIYDAIKNVGRYAGLGERFQSAFNYLQSTDLSRMPVGRYAIDGEDVYIMVQEIALKPWREGRWEAHCRYADIQIVSGKKAVTFFAATESRFTSCPSMMIWPSVKSMTPAAARNVVVFPAPFGPISVRISPFFSSICISSISGLWS